MPEFLIPSVNLTKSQKIRRNQNAQFAEEAEKRSISCGGCSVRAVFRRCASERGSLPCQANPALWRAAYSHLSSAKTFLCDNCSIAELFVEKENRFCPLPIPP